MRRVLAALAASLAIFAAARADAYCRSSVCPRREDGSTKGHICTPPQPDDCGVPLQWRQPCIGFNVREGDSAQITFADALVTFTLALSAWTEVDCGNGTPSIAILELGPVSCGEVEYNQNAGNSNLIVFRDDFWPHETDTGLGNADTLALTTVTYDLDTGDLYDADIEINTANNHFTLGDSPGPDDVDLLSVLTHEAGHFLGIAHSAELGTTMFPDYSRGTTTIRNLTDDDRAAICVAYPPDRALAGECTGLPRHGFAPECGADQTYVKCAMGSGGGALPIWPVLSALALLGLRRTIRGRRGTPRW